MAGILTAVSAGACGLGLGLLAGLMVLNNPEVVSFQAASGIGLGLALSGFLGAAVWSR